ncbi:MAG TPA: hypothetical protein PKN08_08125, partial [Opitutaceae bacterium]|nr:hypothetical protein [Opitutaceae bacterium]
HRQIGRHGLLHTHCAGIPGAVDVQQTMPADLSVPTRRPASGICPSHQRIKNETGWSRALSNIFYKHINKRVK